MCLHTVNFDRSKPQRVENDRREVQGRTFLDSYNVHHISKFYHQDISASTNPQMFISKFQGFFFLPTAQLKFGSRWWGRSPLGFQRFRNGLLFFGWFVMSSEVLHFTFENIFTFCKFFSTAVCLSILQIFFLPALELALMFHMWAYIAFFKGHQVCLALIVILFHVLIIQ